MGIADELQKLEQLRRSGTLTDAEFVQAKAVLLTNPPVPTNVQIGSILEDQLAEVRYHNELARIDREWEIQRRQFQMVGRYGRVYTPTFGLGLATAVGGGFFGAFWTVMAFAITSVFPDDRPFGIIKLIFPFFGIIFTATAIGLGLYNCVRAQLYKEAFRAYQEKHRQTVSANESVERYAPHGPQ